MPRLFRRGRHTKHTVCSAFAWDRGSRAAYGRLFDELALLLVIADPMSIYLFGNHDEYSSEATKILSRIRECQESDDLARVIVEVFDQAFWPGAVTLEKAMPIAQIAFRASCRHGITRWPGWETRTCTLEQA